VYSIDIDLILCANMKDLTGR